MPSDEIVGAASCNKGEEDEEEDVAKGGAIDDEEVDGELISSSLELESSMDESLFVESFAAVEDTRADRSCWILTV